MTDKWNKVYTDFAGIDYIITQDNKEIGKAQSIAYSITEEMGPPKFHRGKKGIAGTIIFNDESPDKIIGPFNIKLLAADEEGNTKVMWIKGVELIKDGKLISECEIDERVTFVAKDIIEWEDYND